MLILQNIAYSHPDTTLLFENINLTVDNKEKIALIGNNGSGKSTLLQIMAGNRKPTAGEIIVDTIPYYVPQIYGQYDAWTVAQVLRLDKKINALHKILDGEVSEENLELLDDDWTIEERCKDTFKYWNLTDVDLQQKMGVLSGGQKTKILLAGIQLFQPKLILLDEPSNHLDSKSRRLLYHCIDASNSSFVIVSHDRQLLNTLPKIVALQDRKLQVYGGNYDFYAEQKNIAQNALNAQLSEKEKSLRKAKEMERDAIERKQKLDARGKAKQENAGVARIMMNTLRNNAESSSAKLKNTHSDKIATISDELRSLRTQLPNMDKMRFGVEDSSLHKGKILVEANNVNMCFGKQNLWDKDLNFQISSGERMAIKGDNGSGKTTLVRLLLGQIEPHVGTIKRAITHTIYIDQDYSLIHNQLTIFEQAQLFNESALEEHEIKIYLHRFLFTKNDWDKKCAFLSGGERMRLLLCCLSIKANAPDMIILDEPTNNLDIQNVEILAAAIEAFRGTVIAISHDGHFLEQIHVNRHFDV